jgi:hypothetical protein
MKQDTRHQRDRLRKIKEITPIEISDRRRLVYLQRPKRIVAQLKLAQEEYNAFKKEAITTP